MGVGEQCSGGGQPVEVWGLGLRMPGETPHPVIEIVNCDEQYVGGLGGMAAKGYPKEAKNKQAVFHQRQDNRGASKMNSGQAKTSDAALPIPSLVA